MGQGGGRRGNCVTRAQLCTGFRLSCGRCSDASSVLPSRRQPPALVQTLLPPGGARPLASHSVEVRWPELRRQNLSVNTVQGALASSRRRTPEGAFPASLLGRNQLQVIPPQHPTQRKTHSRLDMRYANQLPGPPSPSSPLFLILGNCNQNSLSGINSLKQNISQCMCILMRKLFSLLFLVIK